MKHIKKNTDTSDTSAKLIDRSEHRVSAESLWPHLTWRFKHSTSGKRIISIGWQFPLPDGTLSTDSQHRLLLRSFQEVFWGLINNTGYYGKPLSIGSIPRIGVGIKELFRWMVFRGYRSFFDLDSSVQQRYLSELPILLANPVEFYSTPALSMSLVEDVIEEAISDEEITATKTATAENSKSDPDDRINDDDNLPYSRVEIRINTFNYIYSQLNTLNEQGIPAIQAPPFDGLKTSKVVNQVTSFTIRRIPPLPDEVATPLLTEAIKRICHKGEDIVRLQTQFIEFRSKYDLSNFNSDELYSGLNAIIENFEFSIIPGERRPWREKIVSVKVDTPEMGPSELVATQVLRHEVMRTVAACVIVIQYMSGLRISEVCSTKAGINSITKLPSCIDIELTKSGLMEVFKLKAKLSKGVPTPVDEKWVIGARPVGSSHLPLTVIALKLLDKLLSPWRTLAHSTDMIVGFTNRRGLPRFRDSVSEVSSYQLLREIKNFIYYEVDLSKLPDRNARGEDLSMYRDTKGYCIKTHQGRKTFSAYVLETRSSHLRAVSEHFKHLTLTTTENAYFSHTSKYTSERENIIYSETVSYMVSIITGLRITGKMAEVVDKYFSEAGFKEIDDMAELERKVEKLVYMHDLRIFFSDHGKCFIRCMPLESRCHEVSGGASWHKVSPNFSNRSPGLCSGCRCFGTDSSHLPYWEARAKEMSEVLKKAKAAGRDTEYRVIKLRAEQSIKIVKSIKTSLIG
ncbi:hypothetical protein [Noviherbaspirillum malthae]|uniref:hypothetical protein n=1 Tax=Noviherbaspirillum malthae TaxID=1260987 RepID=UPI00188F64BD|nr:hypothetical protein [Noviherbaspirillum malthae]